ncbi:MAG: radical SAM protein [Dehalococcoidia bacterium]
MAIDTYLPRRAARKLLTIAQDRVLATTHDVHDTLRGAVVLPNRVDFETTNVCNANCVFCAYQFQTRPTGVMDMELYDRLIRETAALGVPSVGFTPLVGDPLVDPHIVARVRLAHELGIPSIGFFTNGILFRAVGIDSILTSGLTDIRLSTAGFDDASYRRVYRSTRYRQMYDGLVELLERNNDLGRPVAVSLAIRADEPLSAIRRKPDYRRIAHLIDGADANLRFDSWSGRISEAQLLPGMTLRRQPDRRFPCSMLYFSLTVLWDGQVTACGCRDLDAGSDLVLGNAVDTSLYDLWSGVELAKLRHDWDERGTLPAICTDCTHYTSARMYLRPRLRRTIETSALRGELLGLTPGPTAGAATHQPARRAE